MDIECNAYPDEIYEGTVSAITTSADSSYSTTVNYPVTVRIEGDTGRLYGGMTADITFVTDSIEAVSYTHLDVYKRQAMGEIIIPIARITR